jgi:hypothetical protein
MANRGPTTWSVCMRFLLSYGGADQRALSRVDARLKTRGYQMLSAGLVLVGGGTKTRSMRGLLFRDVFPDQQTRLGRSANRFEEVDEIE